jgi:hypothetical protein
VSAIYEAIGRLVVVGLLRRYRTQLAAAALVGAAALALGAYLAARPGDEES